MNFRKSPFINSLTNASKEVLDEQVKKALDSSGFTVEFEKLEKERRQIEDLLKEGKVSEEEKVKYDNLLREVNVKIDAKEKKRKAIEKQKREEQAENESQESGGAATERVQAQDWWMFTAPGGCFPGSSTFVDRYGLQREIHSLRTGEKVQIAAKGSIYLEPVITFIHREQDKLQEFLSITTTKNNNLKITGDHLLFVEKNGLSRAIPARDVKIGDTVYVKQNGLMKTATVQDISTVYEKGVYAPVTRSGTILINDVHTSCYFDVLSHKWSHRAMAVPRAVYRVSPGILRWISRLGEKDGFPGWCRLARKILT